MRLSSKPLPRLASLLLLLASFQPLWGTLVPVQLQSEQRVNPLALDVAQPRLQWQPQPRLQWQPQPIEHAGLEIGSSDYQFFSKRI